MAGMSWIDGGEWAGWRKYTYAYVEEENLMRCGFRYCSDLI
jgi:hypothetical protein